MKQRWSYIRENNLQDPSNRRNILCDGTLRDLFGVDSINMFQMNKALAQHIWPLENNGNFFYYLFLCQIYLFVSLCIQTHITSEF